MRAIAVKSADSPGGDYQKQNASSATFGLLAVLLACAYGLLLSLIPFDGIKDRANYLIYAESSDIILADRVSHGIMSAMFNEPLWPLSNILLGFLLDPVQVVKLFVGVPAALIAWVMLRQAPRALPIIVLFLLMPQVLNNHIIFLRQGTAIALFVLAWFHLDGAKKWLAFLLTPFIHASFFFVLPLIMLVRCAQMIRLGPDIRVALVLFFGLATGFGLAFVAEFLGARQAEHYLFRSADVSGLGFVFWFGVLLLFLSAGRGFLRSASFESAAIVFYLSTYFLIEVTARIFESCLILVLLAGLRLSGVRRLTFVALILLYGLLIYASRVGKPLLGFGVEI